MTRLACAILLVAVGFWASKSEAIQLTNRDTADHKIVVTEKNGTKEFTLKPSQVLDDICVASCTIKMVDGEEYEFDGNEVVSIEEGLMFLDEASDAGPSDTGNADPQTSEGEGAGEKPE